MKNKVILMLFAALGMLLSNCNKSLLNTSPNDRYVESNFWESEAAAQAALAGCYGVLTSTGMYGGVATPLFEETASPNAYNYDNSEGFNFIAEGLQSASSSGIIPDRWKACYTGIGRCNTFLVKVDEVAMDDALKSRMKGEAYFLRALYYFTLQNYYGDVPLVLDPPDRATQTNLPGTAREEVVAKIYSDLDSAAAVLPLKFTGGDAGRATKGAALALKARVSLFEASPLFNAGNDNSRWQKAADDAKAVMDLTAAGYGLYANYRNLFLPQNENNKEVIFDVQFIYPDLGNSFDLIDKQYNTNAPLLDMAAAYEMNNGLPITDPASGFDPANPYKDRDPRLYQTIVYPGDTFMTVKFTASFSFLISFILHQTRIQIQLRLWYRPPVIPFREKFPGFDGTSIVFINGCIQHLFRRFPSPDIIVIGSFSGKLHSAFMPDNISEFRLGVGCSDIGHARSFPYQIDRIVDAGIRSACFILCFCIH
jgi:hypothetical protein